MKSKNDVGISSESPEEMVEHISRLMGEAEALLVGPVSDRANDKLSELKERYQALQTRASAVFGDAREKVIEGAKKTDETIRAHPYESLAVALGVGVLIGALLRRR